MGERGGRGGRREGGSVAFVRLIESSARMDARTHARTRFVLMNIMLLLREGEANKENSYDDAGNEQTKIAA